MKKFLTKFNLVCLSLDVIFLLGIVWVWRNTLSLDHQITPSLNNPIVSSSLVSSLSDNNIIIEHSNNEKTSSTKDINTEKRDSSVLPRNYVLDVPFTSQAPEKNWDQPWQDACEEAALLMLDAYYKNYNLSPLFARDEILKMMEWETGLDWGYSIEIEKVKQMASEYFSLDQLTTTSPNHLRIIENPTIDDIKKSIVKGNPVLVVADGKVLPNPHFRNGGPVYHALVIKGYDEDEFITNDPGTQFGESFRYKYDDLMNAIHDWNSGDVKNGRRVVLMIE